MKISIPQIHAPDNHRQVRGPHLSQMAEGFRATRQVASQSRVRD
jgi:hypothetical protein